MANFAAAMMRAMSEINFEDMDIVENASDHFKLRVGISAGPVIAGKSTLNNHHAIMPFSWMFLDNLETSQKQTRLTTYNGLN